MKKVHIFVDGSWLFGACKAGKAMAATTANATYPFLIDWEKLNAAILEHVSSNTRERLEIGERYVATSVFELPNDFDDWPNRFLNITDDQIQKTKRVVYSKNKFVEDALRAGYSEDAVHRPKIKDWIMERLADDSYQEKQVDTTVVALLVKSAITKPHDYHVVLSGDADMLPAVRVAYPEYTNNVLVATTHPDELDSGRRQSSFSYFDFNFSVEPFFLQQNAEKIIAGNFIYRCVECGKLFANVSQVPSMKQPRCLAHRA